METLKIKRNKFRDNISLMSVHPLFNDMRIKAQNGEIEASKAILCLHSVEVQNLLVDQQVNQWIELKLDEFDIDSVKNMVTLINQGEVEVTKTQSKHLKSLLNYLKIEFGEDHTSKIKVEQGEPLTDEQEAIEEDEDEFGLVPLEDGKILCLRCKKTSSNLANGKRHYKNLHMTDKSNKRFMCKVCKKEFAVELNMKQHLRDTHGLSQKMLKNKIKIKKEDQAGQAYPFVEPKMKKGKRAFSSNKPKIKKETLADDPLNELKIKKEEHEEIPFLDDRDVNNNDV